MCDSESPEILSLFFLSLLSQTILVNKYTWQQQNPTVGIKKSSLSFRFGREFEFFVALLLCHCRVKRRQKTNFKYLPEGLNVIKHG